MYHWIVHILSHLSASKSHSKTQLQQATTIKNSQKRPEIALKNSQKADLTPKSYENSVCRPTDKTSPI
jgi:hypothetical protein